MSAGHSGYKMSDLAKPKKLRAIYEILRIILNPFLEKSSYVFGKGALYYELSAKELSVRVYIHVYIGEKGNREIERFNERAHLANKRRFNLYTDNFRASRR